MTKSTKKKHSISSKKHTRKKSSTNLVKISPEMFKKYNELSPFELKNTLIKMAKEKGVDTSLDAGRGNPNFFNVFARKVFAKLQLLAMNIADKKGFLHDLDLWPTLDQYNYEKLLKEGSAHWPDREKKFFHAYLAYLKKQSIKDKKNYNHILHDVVLSTIGSYYPSPPRIQPHLKLVAEEFLYDLTISGRHAKGLGNKLKPEDFDLFATEGAAAGIQYVFNTLHENFLLRDGDTIALITPIFSPYLEIPKLTDYDLNIVQLKGNPDKDFSLDDEQINKLKDKKIKALFMVNPLNPGAFSLSKENIDAIGKIVNTERQDLIVLSDNVYAPFTREYNSFMLTCPLNTIEVFSLSKYFGTTGWRLGLAMIPKNSRLNTLLEKLPTSDKKKLDKRYETISLKPSTLTFMDRLVADSRQVADAHVAGLSTPQQVLIGLFLFYDMHDTSRAYKKEIHKLLITRLENTYKYLKTPVHIDEKSTDYYNLLFLPQITENLYGKKAKEYLLKHHNYVEFLFHLAKKYQVVLLPGGGFGADDWRQRISLANLTAADYLVISKSLASCIKDFVKPAL